MRYDTTWLPHRHFMPDHTSDDKPAADAARPAAPDLTHDEGFGVRVPEHRPLKRFWPYADLPEQPTDEELAALDPDLRAELFGAPPLPFSITLQFPSFDGAEYDRAVALARASAEYREIGQGSERRHRARYYPADVLALRELFAIVGRLDACEVLVDDRPVPYARELWLPMMWFLLPR